MFTHHGTWNKTSIACVFCLLQLLQCVFSYLNLSVNKTADMSSSQYSDKWLADKAVDGDVSQKLAQGSCAVTSDNFHKQVWLRVDLGDVFVLNSVKIYYRKESGNPTESLTDRLSGFSIYVADTLNWWIGTRCYLHNNGEHTNPGPSDILTVPCNATGRYVTVYKQRNITCVWSPHPLYKHFCARFEICEVQILSCDDGTYGASCSNNCSGNCLNGAHCNKTHGGCDHGCAPGYRGFYCNDECENGTFGLSCSYTCGHCRDYSCNQINGTCSNGCVPGWKGIFCKDKCMSGTFGSNCSNVFGNCIGNTCNHINGTCSTGCSSGWEGPYCNEKCNHGFHGQQCSRTCTLCAETCHHVTGKCLVNGRQKPTVDDNNTVMVGINATSGILNIVLSVALILTCLRLRNLSSIREKNCTNLNPTHPEHTQVQMSNIVVNTHASMAVIHPETATDTRNDESYEAVMFTTNDSNTYETFQPDRVVTYANTQLVY